MFFHSRKSTFWIEDELQTSRLGDQFLSLNGVKPPLVIVGVETAPAGCAHRDIFCEENFGSNKLWDFHVPGDLLLT